MNALDCEWKTSIRELEYLAISNSNLSVNKDLNDPSIFVLYVILSCEQLYYAFVEFMYFVFHKTFYI